MQTGHTNNSIKSELKQILATQLDWNRVQLCNCIDAVPDTTEWLPLNIDRSNILHITRLTVGSRRAAMNLPSYCVCLSSDLRWVLYGFEETFSSLGKCIDTSHRAKYLKRNFRCAMQSLKDVELVTDMGCKNGTNAYVVYRFLPVQPKRRGRRVISWMLSCQIYNLQFRGGVADEYGRDAECEQLNERTSAGATGCCRYSKICVLS